MKEDRESWLNFLVSLKEYGLRGMWLFVGDKCLGILDAINAVYPKTKYQRCTVHFYRNVFTVVPRGKVKEVAAMLKAIHAQKDQAAAREKAKAVVRKKKDMKIKEAAENVEDSINETLTFIAFPNEHWLKIRSNNTIEQLNREIRRQTRVVGVFPDANSV
jgi:putative transposase